MSKERKLLTRVAFETVHNNGISEKLYGEIETCLAEPAQEPKPVAWLRNDRQVVLQNRQNGYDIPLYETPPSAAKRIAELEGHLEHEKLCINDYVYIVDELKGKIEYLEARINKGVRVYAYIDRYDELAVDMDTEPYGPNATLLRDEV